MTPEEVKAYQEKSRTEIRKKFGKPGVHYDCGACEKDVHGDFICRKLRSLSCANRMCYFYDTTPYRAYEGAGENCEY